MLLAKIMWQKLCAKNYSKQLFFKNNSVKQQTIMDRVATTTVPNNKTIIQKQLHRTEWQPPLSQNNNYMYTKGKEVTCTSKNVWGNHAHK